MGEFQSDISAKRLLELYSDMIYRIAFARTQNKADAEDITQNVFLKYIDSNKRFNDEEHRKAWLLRVAVNCTNDFVKSAHYRNRAPIEDVPDAEVHIEENSEIYHAVQSLPEKYRLAVHLFYYEDMSVAEISALTKIKETTVKSQLSRARDMLRKILKEAQYEL